MIQEEIRICVKCNTSKPISEYGFRKKNNIYRRSCKECERKRDKEYRKNNPDKVKANVKKHYQENKEYYKTKHAVWKEDNPDYYLKYMGEWREKNRDSLRIKTREYSRKRYNEDENYRIRMLLGGRMRRVLSQQRINKNNSTFGLLGCSIEEFKKHIENQFKEGMTWGHLNNGEIHIDHIQPCCTFDLTKEKQLKECFHHTNMQPLWAIDNFRKAKKNYGKQ